MRATLRYAAVFLFGVLVGVFGFGLYCLATSNPVGHANKHGPVKVACYRSMT